MGAERIKLITTNDNLPAMRFYQKRGFHRTRLYRNAVEQARRLKPKIPLIGMDGLAFTGPKRLYEKTGFVVAAQRDNMYVMRKQLNMKEVLKDG